MNVWGVLAAVGGGFAALAASGLGLAYLVGGAIYDMETTDDGVLIE